MFKNANGDLCCYVPVVHIVDPSCAGLKQHGADYITLCQNFINQCDISIEQLKTLRETYEKRMVNAVMGIEQELDK